MTTVLNYGGGRQTVAICVLIDRGVLPKPDRIVMADTGRENPMTWDYLKTHVAPMLQPHGLEVEIAPRSLATVDMYAKNGTLLLPVFIRNGKLSAFCSGEWKREVVARYLRLSGVTSGERWIGFSLDERQRAARILRSNREPNWSFRLPLFDLMLTADDCKTLITRHGLPLPHRSSCWMCPHKSNAEWRVIRDQHPDQWEQACQIDEEIRQEDIDQGNTGVYLHHSRTPLREADLDTIEEQEVVRQCGLGMCFL